LIKNKSSSYTAHYDIDSRSCRNHSMSIPVGNIIVIEILIPEEHQFL
jgi:hypothetical protein